MKIAIVGPGRIGSTFAFHLARAGHEITVIARGARFEALNREGAIVSVAGDRASVKTASALDPETPFDLVLVTVLAHQAEALLPVLQASSAKTVMFMFNTFEKVERLRGAVGAQRFASGFPNMTAFFVEGRLKSKVDGPGMVTTLTSETWAAIFKQAGMPTEVENDIDSFLRSHVAFVVPLMAAANLVYKRDTELTWAEAKKLTAALVEALDLVRGLGHTLKPGFVGALAMLPSFVLCAVIWQFSRTAAVKDLGEFGPTETQELIDAMTAAAPGKTDKLLAIRP